MTSPLAAMQGWTDARLHAELAFLATARPDLVPEKIRRDTERYIRDILVTRQRHAEQRQILEDDPEAYRYCEALDDFLPLRSVPYGVRADDEATDEVRFYDDMDQRENCGPYGLG